MVDTPDDWSLYSPTASDEIVEAACELRRRLTPAELVLWEQLRNRRLLGRKFRKQHPFGPFVLDFFCDDARLVVELDGSVHLDPHQRERDVDRQRALETLAFTVMRFSNTKVFDAIDEVLSQIADHLRSHTYERRSGDSESRQRSARGANEGRADADTSREA